MGFLDLFSSRRRGMLNSFGQGVIDLGIASPWAEGSLSSIVITDMLGEDMIDKLPMTRAEAITIPAVSKARNLLVSAIAPLPLTAMRGTVRVPVSQQPTFLYRTNSNVTPYERMAWTVDDIIFFGYSLWYVERGATKDGRRDILNAEYVPMQSWKITNGHILIDEQPVDSEEVILFNSPYEGLLNIGSRTLRGARDIETAWVGRSSNPVPIIELHQTDDTLQPEEVPAFVKAWGDARTQKNGAIGYTPSGLEIRTHGEVKADLMTEGRNAVRTDIGSLLNIRASMLDGTMGIDSLTYTTTAGERNAFYDLDLPFWTNPIEARLSMDDIVPRGMRVRFDRTEQDIPTPTGAPVED